jgi:hypothetical protein
MRRLYPFLGWLWGVILAVVVVGPLGSYVYDELKDKDSLHALKGYLLLYRSWWAVGGTFSLGAACGRGTMNVNSGKLLIGPLVRYAGRLR